jgi:hypothetical protein
LIGGVIEVNWAAYSEEDTLPFPASPASLVDSGAGSLVKRLYRSMPQWTRR